MSSLPATAQANNGSGAESTSPPQRARAFNRFIIGLPAQLPIPQDGSPSSEADRLGSTSLLEAQLAAQTAQIAQLMETVKAFTQNVAEMENVAEAEMENVVKVENAVVVVANAEVNAADVVLPQPSQPNNEQISPPRSLLIPACFDNQCFLALLLL